MNIDGTTVHTPTTAATVRRLLAVLAIAFAMVAISAFSPPGAGAMPMSERSASRLCRNAGGHVHYEFGSGGSANDVEMSCTLPSGASFHCLSYGSVWECF